MLIFSQIPISFRRIETRIIDKRGLMLQNSKRKVGDNGYILAKE